MTVIDGKAVSAKVKNEIAVSVNEIKKRGFRSPCLAVILVGEDPASQIYVRNKKRACEQVGITSLEYLLKESTKEEELLSLIDRLNEDDSVDGILVQMPVPKHISSSKVIDRISKDKDVDSFSAYNVGMLNIGTPVFQPCTPAGIMRLLSEYNISPAGKNCVVVGRSNIVGKPMAALLLAADGTVTVCHSKTKDLAEFTKRADILVVACGKAKLIDGSMIKENAVVIDVGMNRTEGHLCGDCDFESCSRRASYMTPVPGGVGPMTIAILLQNTLLSCRKRFSL